MAPPEHAAEASAVRRDRAADFASDASAEAEAKRAAAPTRQGQAAAAAAPAPALSAAAPPDRRGARSDPTVAERVDAGLDPFTGEPRATDGGPRGASISTQPAAADLPRTAVLQIVEAMRGGSSSIDLTLSPEELGRVKLSLGTHDGTLHVVVHADRPETGDLIRRSLDLLLAEARSEGFEDVTFSFAGSGHGAGGGRDDPDHPIVPTQAADPPAPRAVPTVRPDGGAAGLDLRL